MKLTFKVPANEGELFAEEAFEGSVGTEVDVVDFGRSVILEAEVIEGGKSALITIRTLDQSNRSVMAHRGKQRRIE